MFNPHLTLSGPVIHATDQHFHDVRPHSMHERQQAIEREFAQARTNAYASTPSGTHARVYALTEARSRYPDHMIRLRAEFQQPLRRVPLRISNCDDSFSPEDFRVLERCASLSGWEVFNELDHVVLHNDSELEQGIDGTTWVIHPNFEDKDNVPWEQTHVQVSLNKADSLTAKIVTMCHEFSMHLIPSMEAAVTGYPQPPEEAGHFANLAADSDYHRQMVRLERNWDQMSTLSGSVEEPLYWEDIKEHYLTDIGLQMSGYLQHLNLDSDQIDQLTEQYNAGSVNMLNLPDETRAGLKANLFWAALRRCCEDELPISTIPVY